MKYESVCRETRRGIALGIGLCLAVLVFSGSHTLAAQASTTTTTAAPASAALSIEPEAGYQDAVLRLAARGVVDLAGDPSFAPTDIASRAELAAYIARVLLVPKEPTLAFGDVGAAHWAYGAIQAVCDAGLMKSASATTFSPEAPVSRQEAVAVVVAAMRYPTLEQDALSAAMNAYEVPDWLAGFQDRNFIDQQYAEPVATAVKLQLIDRPAEGWLLPKLSMTHQELLVLLDRAFTDPPDALVARASITPVPAVDAYPKVSKGSKGPLVLMLQQRLSAMTYVCGTPDGKFSSQTRDAVYAFQKYYRLKRTGKVDQVVWDAFWAAAAPVPVYPGDAGRRVETDLTRQIMMLIRDNKVFMTIHVSTGKYGTPTGHWRIRTRSHSWRPTSLGPVFAPCYFMARNAIHGYGSVPTYPASHNCIRTPLWVQLKIVDELEMGELVHVFNNKVPTTK